MKEQDLKVLCCLREDGRMKLTEMARKTRLPISTLFEKLKNYEKNELIKHCALVDFSKLGFNTRAMILIRANAPQRENITKFLITHLQINAVNKINNGFDFAVEGIFRNMQHAEQFTEELEEKGCKCVTHYLVSELKKEGFMNDMELLKRANEMY